MFLSEEINYYINLVINPSTGSVFINKPHKNNTILFNRFLNYINLLHLKYKKAMPELNIHSFLNQFAREVYAYNAKLPLYYLAEWLNSGEVTLKNQRLTKANLEVQDITYQNLINFCNHKNKKLLQCIVTADGKLYFAIRTHEELVKFLGSTGVNLKGAIRINNDYQGGQFFLSSLESFNLVFPELAYEKSISITQAQANTILKYYEAIKPYRGSCFTLGNALYFSEGLGFCQAQKYKLDYYKNYLVHDNFRAFEIAIINMFGEYPIHRKDLHIFNLISDICEDNRVKRLEILKHLTNDTSGQEHCFNE